MGTQYSITIEGLLDQKWQDRFEGFKISHSQGRTVIEGDVGDQSCLYGLLNLLRDLNLKLISVESGKTLEQRS